MSGSNMGSFSSDRMSGSNLSRSRSSSGRSSSSSSSGPITPLPYIPPYISPASQARLDRIAAEQLSPAHSSDDEYLNDYGHLLANGDARFNEDAELVAGDPLVQSLVGALAEKAASRAPSSRGSSSSGVGSSVGHHDFDSGRVLSSGSDYTSTLRWPSDPYAHLSPLPSDFGALPPNFDAVKLQQMVHQVEESLKTPSGEVQSMPIHEIRERKYRIMMKMIDTIMNLPDDYWTNRNEYPLLERQVDELLRRLNLEERILDRQYNTTMGGYGGAAQALLGHGPSPKFP